MQILENKLFYVLSYNLFPSKIFYFILALQKCNAFIWLKNKVNEKEHSEKSPSHPCLLSFQLSQNGNHC